MSVLFIILVIIFPSQLVAADNIILVESPFYLRARIHDSQTASVHFEIPEKKDHRTCRMYQFTIRRNDEKPYEMPEQNLTYWSNSLELKHLAAGDYRICAVICSERSRRGQNYYRRYQNKTHALPITACINFHAFRPHLLILTLYVLVLLFLFLSHVVFSLRKRQFKARMKTTLTEIESAIQKWRTTQASLSSSEHIQSFSILQSLVTLPAAPPDHPKVSPPPSADEGPHPIVFHLDLPSEHPTTS